MIDNDTVRPGATDIREAASYAPPAVVATFSIDELRRDAAAAGTTA